MKAQLVVFDMDGTLVQSEDCASQALIDVIPALTASVAEVTSRYRGVRLAEIFADIESRSPGAIPEGCLDLYRVRENELSHSMITPSQGADKMLARLTVDKCIASNAPVEKTRRSLEICGLSGFFDAEIYSAYQVQAWKPDPDLFLYAAAAHSAEPSDCLVIEDSEVGLMAAQAAGMPAVFYDPHHLSTLGDEATTIHDLTQLLDLLI